MANYHGSNEVISELREDGILILTINRPEKRNALNGATSAKMEEILNLAEKDKAVRVIIVTGAGEKSFCAGEDLSELSSTGECQTVTEHGFGGLTNMLSAKPIICMARELPRKIAMELCLTGKLIYADEAKEIGIVNYVVEPEELMNKAIELAETIAANAPLSLKITKEIMHVAPSMSLDDAMRYSDTAYRFIEKTADGVEGPLAFMEKRKPNWSGK